MSLEVRVNGTPSRCPYCKDALSDLRDVVACASCGARHHAECRSTHGRCVVCASTELLVYQSTDQPVASAGLSVLRERDRTTYRWKLMAKEGLALVPATGFLRVEGPRLTFLAVAQGRRFSEASGERSDVGEVVSVGRKLLVDVRGEEVTVATESIGYALATSDVEVLAAAIAAWKNDA